MKYFLNYLNSDLFSNIKWNVFGLIFSRLAVFVFTIITVKLLTAEEFSEFSYYRNILNIGLVLSGSSLSVAAVFFSSKTNNFLYLKLVKSSLFAIAITLSFLSLFLYYWLPDILSYFKSENFGVNQSFLFLLFLPLFFCILLSITTGYFSGRDNFKSIAISAIVSAFIALPIQYIFVLHFKVLGGIFALLCYYFINLSVLLYTTRSDKPLLFSFNFLNLKLTKKIFLFSLPLLASQLIFLPVRFYLETISLQEIGFKEFALFQFLSVIQVYVVFVISSVSNPLISFFNKNEYSSKRKWIDFNLSLVIGFIFFITFLLLKPMFFYFLGADYINSIDSNDVYEIFMLITAIMIFKTSLFRVLTITSKTYLSFESNIIWTLVLLIGFFFIYEEINIVLRLSTSLLIAFTINTIYLITRLMLNNTLKLSFVISTPFLMTLVMLLFFWVFGTSSLVLMIALLSYILIIFFIFSKTIKK